MKGISFLYRLPSKLWFVISDRYLNASFIRFITITIILFAILNFIIAFQTSSGGRNIYGSWAGGDYSCFYIAGKILNDNPPGKLYDFHSQSELLHSLLPKISRTEELPYVNPPFFALIFKPLSRLPFMASYFSWVLISCFMYIFGFKLLWQTLDSIPAKTSALLLVLSFEPFIMETILGGNTSIVGYLAVVLYLYFENLNKEILAGSSLGILLYKPTFLIIILPMVLIARRAKILLGFCICSVVLICLSVLTVGFEICVEYLRFLLGVSTSTLSGEEIFRTWKYVDIFSFSQLLFGSITLPVLILIVIISLIPFIFLIKKWWGLSGLNKGGRELLNASALTLTTILNLHFGIYDTVILVPSILLTVNVFYRSSEIYNIDKLTPSFEALLVSIYILPWISQYMARIAGLQLFTLAIAILASYQIILERTFPKLFKQYSDFYRK